MHVTEIERPNNLNSDGISPIDCWAQNLKRNIERKYEESNNLLVQIAELQQQVEQSREMHDERVRMPSPASTITIPLENVAQGIQTNLTVIVGRWLNHQQVDSEQHMQHIKQKVFFIYKRRAIVVWFRFL